MQIELNFFRMLSIISPALVTLLGFSNAFGVDNPTPSKPKVFTQDIKLETQSQITVLPGAVETLKSTVVLSTSEGLTESCSFELGQVVQKGQNLCFIRNSDPAYTFKPVSLNAPFSGSISEIFVTSGAQVQKGDKIVGLLDTNATRFVVEAPSQVASLLKLGHVANWESLDGKPLGKIKLKAKAPALNPVTRTQRLEFSAASGVLPFGQVGRLLLTQGERKVFRIPESALTYDGKKPKVRLVKEGKVLLTFVELGKSDGEFVEVLQGISEGNKLILRSSKYVTDGTEVDLDSK